MNFHKLLIFSIGTTSFFSAFMGSSIGVAVPALSAQFALPPEQITYMITAFAVTVTAALLPATALSRRMGCKRVFSIGVLGSAVLALLIPLMPNFTLVLLTRALQGIFNALIFASNMAVISVNLPPNERGAVIGFNVAMVYAGLTLSPGLGGFLTDLMGWQALFYLASLGNLVALMLSAKIPDDPSTVKGYPLKRMSLCFVALAMTLLGLSQVGMGLWAQILLSLGLLGTAWYLVTEHRAKRQIFPLRLLKTNLVLSYQLLAASLNYMATFAIPLLLSMYLQLILGFSASMAGLLLIIQPLLQCSLSPVAGKLTEKYPPHLMAIAGMILCACSALVLIFLSPQSTLWLLVAAQILAGTGFGLFSAPSATIMMGSVDKKDMASASGMQALSRNLGMAIAMAILNIIMLTLISAEQDTTLYVRELSFALQISFMVQTVLGMAGILMCLLSKKAQSKPL